MLVGGLETHEVPPTAGLARGGTGPLSGGRGVRAPEACWSGQAYEGQAPARGGPGPPWRVRIRGDHSLASWARGGPGLLRA
jgi:hypothetical protein